MNKFDGAAEARRRHSGEQTPALAVAFDVAEAAPALGAEAEVEFFHIGIVPERLGGAVEHNPPAFQHVAVGRVAQRDVGILFRQ